MKSDPSDTPGALIKALVRDFKQLPTPGPRFVEEMECLVAVLLAIAVAHWMDLSNVAWAAFSAYMVIRASIADSARRGALRVLGTIGGVSLAWLLAPHLLQSPVLLSLALAVVGGTTLYLSLQGTSGYGWMFTGLSFAMVVIDSMEFGGKALGSFVSSRLLEVVVGSAASLLVSAMSTMTARRYLHPCESAPTAQRTAVPFSHQVALRHALKGAIALALIPWVWQVFHFRSLSQSGITIMTVMMVPMVDLVAANDQSSARSRHRFLGAGIGGLLATGILFLSHGSPTFMTLAACIGVVVGRHIENGKFHIGYAGTQFALAFLVVLVPDGYEGVNAGPGLDRVAGILLGMALLEPVRMLFRLVHVTKSPASG